MLSVVLSILPCYTWTKSVISNATVNIFIHILYFFLKVSLWDSWSSVTQYMNILFRLKKFVKSFSRKVSPASNAHVSVSEPPSTCFVHSWLYFHRVLWVQVLDFASKDLSYLSVKALCILKILIPCQIYTTNIFPSSPFPFLRDTIFLYRFLIFKLKKPFP